MAVGAGGEAVCCGRAVETNPITPPATTTTASAGTNLVIIAMLLRLTRVHLETGQQLSQQVICGGTRVSESNSVDVPPTMLAIRLHAPGGLDQLRLETIETPHLHAEEALVRVHAAAITRDELDWPVDRLPAIPTYEVSGVVAALAPGVNDVSVGQSVYALTQFDRDGAAAEYVALASSLLVAKPQSIDDVESAALPLAGLSAWQGLFDHGRLGPGQRVLVHGATGGVGHLAAQIAKRHGAYVIGTASAADAERARGFGADEVLDASTDLASTLDPVDLVFDTVGGDRLARSPAVVRPGGRLVSIAEEPPEAGLGAGITATYFVVEPNRDQLVELTRMVDDGQLRPAVDSVFPLAEARAAFARSMSPGKHGKVVLRIRE
jgi:NADPH:quinone reductase-like Zn-dependent oxidoreductase